MTACPLVLVLAGSMAVASSQIQAPVIPTTDAARIFARAHALCAADAGRLWGVSLCVPMLLADPNTHQAAANMPLPDSVQDGSIFRLTLPADAPISNSPTVYDSVRLAELMWPLTGTADARAVTYMHESFHVVQPKLGFNGYAGVGSISGDAYLDTQPGRVWMRGELHALRAALQATGEARVRAVRDALAMRFYRHSLSAGTAELERQQDIMEGLAEATGIDAGLPPSHRIAYAVSDIALVEAQPSYARAFPYATGPAYSELLDAVKRGWRRAVTSSSDIAQMTMRAYGLSIGVPTASQAQSIIVRYGGAAIESQEAARAARKVAMDAAYTRELINGSTITLPMTKFHITFNPRDIETFASYGSVYHTLRVTAAWGSITVSGGDAMISNDFKFLTVAAPAHVHGDVLRGQGWTLNLTTGYAIVADPKKTGSYLLSAQH